MQFTVTDLSCDYSFSLDAADLRDCIVDALQNDTFKDRIDWGFFEVKVNGEIFSVCFENGVGWIHPDDVENFHE